MKDPELVAEVIDAAARGKIGHRAAMQKLNLTAYPDLLETMRLNGKALWAHKASRVDSGLVDLLRDGCATDIPPLRKSR